MKKLLKIYLFLILVVFAGSCSKEDESPKVVEDVKETITTPVPENVVSFRIKPEEGRVGGYANFQAGEVLVCL